MTTPPPSDFKVTQESIQTSLVATIKSVNRLAAEDLAFQRTVNPEAGELLDEQRNRLLGLSNKLLAAAARTCGVKAPRSLDEVDDIELQWGEIVDVLDSVLENVDTSLDEYAGLIRKKRNGSGADTAVQSAAAAAAAAAAGAAASVLKRPKPSSLDRYIRFANVAKPQLLFELKPDNFPALPWKPLLTAKPHATVPLAECLVHFDAGPSQSQYDPVSFSESNSFSSPSCSTSQEPPPRCRHQSDHRLLWAQKPIAQKMQVAANLPN